MMIIIKLMLMSRICWSDGVLVLFAESCSHIPILPQKVTFYPDRNSIAPTSHHASYSPANRPNRKSTLEHLKLETALSDD